ncbi:O-antigen ligase family protein [Oscillospiraceae bacterium WX1]
MQKILEQSAVFRLLSVFFGWIGAKWHESRLVTWFLTPSRSLARVKSSVFFKAGQAGRRAWSAAFQKLGLTRVLEGSIFNQLYIWCLIPAFLAPFLPTMALVCCVLVAFFSYAVRLGTEPEMRSALSPVNKYVLLFAAVYLIATMTSVTVSGSIFTGLITVLFVLFTIVFNSAVTTKRQADFAVRLLVTAGAAVAAYGIYQYLFYTPETIGAWVDNDMFSDITNRVYSTLGNPNVLAEYLLLVTPFAAACALNGKTWLQRLFFAGCFVLMAVCMVVTYSRGGYIGLILAAAIFLVMLDARFILLGIAAIIALYFFLPQTVIERFASIGNMSDSSTSYRVSIWLGTLSMLKDYWFSGIGPGTAAFNLVYPAYGYNTISAPHAHNLYLQLICDAGILGIVLFLFMLFSYFRNTLAAFSKERDKSSRIYLAAAVSAICGYLLQGMTDYSFYNNRVTLLFWVVLALGLALARRSSMTEGHIWSRS